MVRLDPHVSQLQLVKWQTSTAKGNFSAYVAVGDFNTDGYQDVAVNICDVDGTTPDIVLFLGSASGSFSSGTHLLGERVPTYQAGDPLIVADINRDGVSDIFISNSNGDPDTTTSVKGGPQIIYLSSTAGAFKKIISNQQPYGHGASIADVNGDRYLDTFTTATVVGPSLLGVYDAIANSVTYTTQGLPKKAVDVDYGKSWDVISETRLSDGGYLNIYAGFHQHSSEFLDVNRDGRLDLVMFFNSQKAQIFLNDGSGSPSYSDSHRLAVDTKLSFLQCIDDTFTVSRVPGASAFTTTAKKAGFNPYDIVKFDIDQDGWTDILAVGAYNNEQVDTNENGVSTYINGTDRFNDGTLYEVFINNGTTLVNETESRITQFDTYENRGYHNGFIDNLKVVDLNGDGYLDFLSNNSANGAANAPPWSGEKTHTAFMINDGHGHFSRVEIAGLDYGSFTPVPIQGKLGFVHVRTAGSPPWSASDGSTEATFFVTTVPWTIGDDGNNFLYSTAANDPIDGGGGVDTFYANGRRDTFRYTINGDKTVSVTDLSGIGATDTLTNMERLRFDDVRIALDINGNAGQAYRVYKAAFNRDPMSGDTKGLGYWIAQIDKGMNLTEVSARFVDSNEFRTLYGTHPKNEQFLTKLYQNVLGRQPDATGFNWWLNELNINPEKTQAKVLADFAESAENQTGVIALIGNGITYEPWVG